MTFPSLNSFSVAGDSVPSGVITMWWGEADNIPPGWALCDGTNNLKPDLRDRFVVGAGRKYKSRDTGGADNVALNVAHYARYYIMKL